MAALFCWQEINHSYYVQQLSDNNVGFCQDTRGIELVRDTILVDWNNKYKAILEPFLKRMPDKTFHYVASYMLKGYAMEKNGIAEKYWATSYKSLKRKIPLLLDILDNAYGKSYCQISNPTLVNNEVDLGITNANKGKSRAITHSFGIKLRALMLGEEVEITFCDVQGTKKIYKFTEVERMSFVLFGILYASRCNNFHGNVAARMNSMHIRSDFRKWFPRMCQYGFIEGRDYEYMPRVRLQDEGGRTVQRYVKDYRITQDMAKKLCKLHHTAVGAAYHPQPFDWDALLGLLHKKPPRRSSYEAQLSDSDSLVTTTQIAKEYGCGAKVFNRLLHLYGIQYRANGQWVLYSEHHGKGYTSSLTFRLQRSDGSEVEKLHTAWTQKGRKFLYHTLKRRGVLPLAEQGG